MDNEPPDSAAADPSMPSMYLSLGDHVSTGVSDIGIAMPTLGSKGEMMLLSPYVSRATNPLFRQCLIKFFLDATT